MIDFWGVGTRRKCIGHRLVNKQRAGGTHCGTLVRLRRISV